MEQANPLGYEKISKLVRKFSVPSIISMLISSLYNVVDQLYIGHIPDVGILGNAATNVAYPLTPICLAITLLIGVGAASGFSLNLGQGNKKTAGEIVTTSLWMVIICGIIYGIVIEVFMKQLLLLFGATETVMPYSISYVKWIGVGMPFLMFTNVMNNLVRADGSPRYSMTFIVSGALLNIVLDPIFIFALNLGVEGAAIATAISQIVSCVMAITYLPKFKQVPLSFKNFRFYPRRAALIASLGMSNSFTQLAITLVQISMNNSLTKYGAGTIYGADIPLSAYGIIMKINSIFTSVFIGLASGCQPIYGFNYGARQYDRVRSAFKLAIKCSFVVSVIAFIIFQFFPQYVIGLFGSGNQLYMEFATKFIRTFLMMVIINGVQIISSNFFAAIGKPVRGLLLALSRQCFIIVPLIFILPLFFGIDGLMYSGPVADSVAFILSVIFITLEFKRMPKNELM